MSIPIDQHERLSQCIEFLNKNDKQLNTLFYSQASLAKLEKGQPICHEGNSCSQLAIVLNGTARVYKLGENGKEITLYRVGQGESCILTASLARSPSPPLLFVTRILKLQSYPRMSFSHGWRNPPYGETISLAW